MLFLLIRHNRSTASPSREQCSTTKERWRLPTRRASLRVRPLYHPAWSSDLRPWRAFPPTSLIIDFRHFSECEKLFYTNTANGVAVNPRVSTDDYDRMAKLANSRHDWMCDGRCAKFPTRGRRTPEPIGGWDAAARAWLQSVTTSLKSVSGQPQAKRLKTTHLEPAMAGKHRADPTKTASLVFNKVCGVSNDRLHELSCDHLSSLCPFPTHPLPRSCSTGD